MTLTQEYPKLLHTKDGMNTYFVCLQNTTATRPLLALHKKMYLNISEKPSRVLLFFMKNDDFFLSFILYQLAHSTWVELKCFYSSGKINNVKNKPSLKLRKIILIVYVLKLCDQPILVRGTITMFLILIIPIYWLFMIDKRRVNLKVQFSVVRK